MKKEESKRAKIELREVVLAGIEPTGYALIEDIHQYDIELFARPGNPASIDLYNEAGDQFAIAIFRPDSDELDAQYQGSDGIYRVFYHRSGLDEVIDVLRNEEPAYFAYWVPDGHNTHIGTRREPVGEGES